MTSSAKSIGVLNVRSFCAAVERKYEYPHLVKPEEVAADFLDYFGLNPPLTLDDLKELCAQMGISESATSDMPEGMRGLNITVADEDFIKYKLDDWLGSQKHTILHEIWEIIYRRICSNRRPVNEPPQQSEAVADQFAAAVLMPHEKFLEDCIRYSFEPFEIREKYGQSLISILIRMRTVLEQNASFFCMQFDSAIGYTNDNRWKDPKGLTRYDGHACVDLASKTVWVTDDTPSRGLFRRIKDNMTSDARDADPFNELLSEATASGSDIRRATFHDGVREWRVGCYLYIGKGNVIRRAVITGVALDDCRALAQQFTTSTFDQPRAMESSVASAFDWIEERTITMTRVRV